MDLRRLTPVLALAAALAAGACSDSTKPEDVNPQAVASGMNGLTSSFSSNLAFQSLRELSGSFGFAAPAATAGALVAATLPRGGPEPQGGYGLTPAQRQALLDFGLRAPAGIQALFPADVLGKTFVWDTAQAKYVLDPAATGAPANGVRFKLYLVDPVLHQPQKPLIVVGYVDLTDESTAQADKLGVLVKYASQTIADYDITATVTTSSVTLRAQGYLTDADGSTRLDFDFSFSLSTTALQVNYSLSGSNGFSATIQASVNLSTGASTMLWRISSGGNTVEIAASGTDASLTGAIKFNGVTMVNISGAPDAPVLTTATGRTLTAADLTALRGIFDGFGELMDQIDGLFGPSGLVF